MKKFLDDNFLLNNTVAKKLYHDYAKNMPVYDYHCHINPKEIYENKKYENITQIWLYGDHYKWRAMRSNGIDEEYITGNMSDYEKFLAFAKTLPLCIGNPLYHWCHLELQRYFNIFEELNEQTAPEIWRKTKKCFDGSSFCCRDFIEKSNVKLICTTDDPTDSLEYHIKLKSEDLNFKVYPTFRPDKAVEIRKEPFVPYIKALSDIVCYPLNCISDLIKAMIERIEFFHSVGCRLSDHGIEYVPFCETSEAAADEVFKKALLGQSITVVEEEKYKTYVLTELAKEYAKHHWTMQLHMGAMRNNNSINFEKLGADTGFDSINDVSIALPLSRFMNNLEKENKLPKTILFTLNPKDNYVLGTMIGNFQGTPKGKIQFGSAWWFTIK